VTPIASCPFTAIVAAVASGTAVLLQRKRSCSTAVKPPIPNGMITSYRVGLEMPLERIAWTELYDIPKYLVYDYYLDGHTER